MNKKLREEAGTTVGREVCILFFANLHCIAQGRERSFRKTNSSCFIFLLPKNMFGVSNPCFL